MEDSHEKTVIEFLAANGIDDRASEAVLGASPELQEFVMSRGDLSDARNPSAAILGRLREAQKLSGVGGPGAVHMPNGSDLAPSEEELQMFFLENNIDERAQQILMSTPPGVQRTVLTRGSLVDARNPSSALLGRIKEAQQGAAAAVKGFCKGGGKVGAIAGPGSVSSQGMAADPDTVEAFITDNGIDERAAEALRSASPQQQQVIILRGSLTDTRNPSSALLGRLRDVQTGTFEAATAKGFGKGAAKPAAHVNPEEVQYQVDAFLLQNFVDERATEALRSAAPEVQAAVMARGDLADTRNPSSALCGRVRDAAQSLRGGGGGSAPGYLFGGLGGGGFDSMMGKGQGMRPGGAWHDLDEFIMNNGLDERATDALRQCSSEVQQMVMERGTLVGANNPSSALTGRIRDAKGGGGAKGNGKDDMFGQMMGMMGMSGGSAVKSGELMRFIYNNGLDERAQEALKSCSPEVLRAVIDRGSLTDTRNPSSAVLGRIKDAQMSTGGCGKGGGKNGGGMGGKGEFGGMDDMASMQSFFQAMMGAMGKGGGKGGGNFGGDFGGGFGGDYGGDAGGNFGGDSGSGEGGIDESAVFAFIMENQIDERGSEALLACPAHIQQAVMARGGLLDARSPSSALMGRIRDAQSGKGGGMQSMGKGAGGGGALGPSAAMTNMWGGGGDGLGGSTEAFIAANNLDERAGTALLSCPPGVQAAVMARGSLAECRNPSSAVLGRIRDAQGAGKGRFSPY